MSGIGDNIRGTERKLRSGVYSIVFRIIKTCVLGKGEEVEVPRRGRHRQRKESLSQACSIIISVSQ